MGEINLVNVSVEFRVLSVSDYNLKRAIVARLLRQNSSQHRIMALEGVNLTVKPGDRIGLVGPNGAGKTTLLRIASGVLEPTTGSATVSGDVLPLLGDSGVGLDMEITGRDNIVDLAILYGASPTWIEQHRDEIEELSGLGDRLLMPAHTYSSGMLTRVRISVLVSLKPDILVMDEGIGSADDDFNRKISERMKEFMIGSGSLIMASHSTGLLKQYCTTGLFLDQGRVRAQGPIDEVIEQYQLSTRAEVVG